ncbi:MAG: hypothetical protein HEQ32_08605 [Vampirovibrio sp.]
MISLQPPFSSSYGLNPSPTADPYAALAMPTATNYAVGSTSTTAPTYGTTGDWMNYQTPSTPTYPSTPNYTTTTTTDASTVLAPEISNWQAYAPTDTKVYAPNTETNVNVTDASKVFAPVTVYDEKTHTYNTQIVLVDARQYYNQTNNTTTTPITHPPEIKLPDYPPVQQQQQQQQQQTEKKGGIGDWLLPLGLGAAALFILPKLFKGDKKEEATVTAAGSNSSATAKAEATTTATDEQCLVPEDSPPSKENPKLRKKSVHFTGYGDPKFKSSTGDEIDINKPGSHTLIQDKTSTLKVHMSKKGQFVYMDTINYNINGKTINADSKGNVTVDGKPVSVGTPVDLNNGGSVSVVNDTTISDSGNKTRARIIIKAPNDGSGYENMTIRVRERKSSNDIFYEFDHSKDYNPEDKEEQVTGGELESFYSDANESTEQTKANQTKPKQTKNKQRNKKQTKKQEIKPTEVKPTETVPVKIPNILLNQPTPWDAHDKQTKAP